MKIKLPKRLRGFSYNRVLPVELNTFDVDILLPAVFFQVISEGKDRGRAANDPEEIQKYVRALADHPDVEGFDGTAGQRTLDRLVRTSLVQIGRRGRSRSTSREQILGLTGYTFLAFKPGFPAESSTLRRVPALIYRMMRDQMRSEESCRKFFEDVFGKGIEVRGGAEPTGNYDGHTKLDTLTRLSLAFLDGFESTGVRKPNEQTPPEPCPGLAEQMASDLQRYLRTYRDRMSIEALTYNMRALINVELFVYTLKLFHAVVDLVEDPTVLPPAMRRNREPSLPGVYLDFTGLASGLSRDMAASCVRRDLEEMQRFIVANLTLRQLDRYVRELRSSRRTAQAINRALNSEDNGPDYLQMLLRLRDDPDVSRDIDASARHDEQEIRAENSEDKGGAPGEDTEHDNEEINQLLEGAGSDFEAVVRLIVEAQRSTYSTHIVQWFWSTGGLQKPHGVLHGHLKSRQSWRYAPSNDLLALLVQLYAVQGQRWSWEAPAPQSVSLRDFLMWLEDRFGMLVDRPPDQFSGSEHHAAARDNLQAMLRRLRQMGIFRDLSDDFTVQRLVPPYAGDVAGTAL